ncbi:MAG: ABC transporter permease, partial [Actinomycetales bacterium]
MISTLITGPVNVMGQFFYIGIGGRAAQKEINNYLATATTAETETLQVSGEPTVDQNAAIVFDGVTAGWPDGPDVLRNLSFRLNRGEHVALVGTSGIGKSTVSALIQAHLQSREGIVEVAGL